MKQLLFILTFSFASLLSNAQSIKLPNVFTPNQDSQNDYFVIEVINYNAIKSFEVEVFNRYGDLIKSEQYGTITGEVVINNATKLHIWDGYTNAAAEAPPGTYFYTIKYTNTDNETFTDKSYLTLLR